MPVPKHVPRGTLNVHWITTRPAHPAPLEDGLNNQTIAACPLAVSAEPVRLAYLPGLENAQGEPLAALVAGHPRRPTLLRAFPSITAALVALREMNAGGTG